MISSNIQFEPIGLATEKPVHLEPAFRPIISRNTTRGIKMKTCYRCKQTKQLSEFHKSRRCGIQGYCKSCNVITQRRYRKTPEGKVYQKCYQKPYRQSEKGKISHQASNKCFSVLHPNYIKAHSAVSCAIKTGKLISPKFLLCHYCSKPAQQYHHWKGYAPEHWLDVIPVCKECHYKCKKKIA